MRKLDEKKTINERNKTDEDNMVFYGDDNGDDEKR